MDDPRRRPLRADAAARRAARVRRRGQPRTAGARRVLGRDARAARRLRARRRGCPRGYYLVLMALAGVGVVLTDDLLRRCSSAGSPRAPAARPGGDAVLLRDASRHELAGLGAGGGPRARARAVAGLAARRERPRRTRPARRLATHDAASSPCSRSTTSRSRRRCSSRWSRSAVLRRRPVPAGRPPAGRRLARPRRGSRLAGALLVPLVGERRGTFCVPGDGLGLPACSLRRRRPHAGLPGAGARRARSSSRCSRSTRCATARLPAGEYFFLLLCSVSGALTLAASRDLLTLVVSLEVVSLPAFALVALRRYDGRSSEAALKLFLVSVVSTAVMLFGLSLVYGVTGQVHLARIATALDDPAAASRSCCSASTLALAGLRLQGRRGALPLLGAGHLPGCAGPGRRLPLGGVQGGRLRRARAAADRGLRVRTPTSGVPRWPCVAALTMTVGNLAALRQRHAVRLLAWSSVAQSGYMLVPLGAATVGRVDEVLSATVAYVVAYAVMNLGAFAVVTLVGRHRASNLLGRLPGLGRTEPAVGVRAGVLAGLPGRAAAGPARAVRQGRRVPRAGRPGHTAGWPS